MPGGKGANQAVSMARLENPVRFLGKLGRDSFGDKLLKSMEADGVDISRIQLVDKVSSGLAVINVDKLGNNNIVVIAGANGLVDPDYLHKNKDSFAWADLVVLQFEIPMATVREALKLSRQFGCKTIVNPAPAYELDQEILEAIDIIIPNEHELARISQTEVVDQASLLAASQILLDRGVKEVIVTLGDKGAFHLNREGQKLYPAFKVRALDTTAAGDSFIAGFSSHYGLTGNIEEAIVLGQRVASLTVQKLGAQASLPRRADLEAFK